MKRLAIAAVGLGLVVGVVVAVVAVWASVRDAPWEETASFPAEPTPTVHSLDDEMTEVAKQFLYAWKTPDHDAMKALMDEDGAIVWRGTQIPFSQWADVPSEHLCDGFRYRQIRFPSCLWSYEVVNVIAGSRVCHGPTPAEAANGYGKTCTYWLAYALRRSSDRLYRDRNFCVEVRMKNSIPAVTYAEDGSHCE